MLAFCFPFSANAKGGILVFNTGDELFSVDKLSPRIADEAMRKLKRAYGWLATHFLRLKS